MTDSRPRFQVPIQIPSEGALPSDPLYDVTFTASPSFGIRVIRRSSGELILGEQYRLQSSETETFHYCWRVKSSFRLVWMESTSPCNSLLLVEVALLLIGMTHIAFGKKLVLTV